MFITNRKQIRQLFTAAIFSSAVLAGSACSDSTTNPTRTTTSVEVSPAQRSLTVGEQSQYTARVLDASGQEISGRAIAWSSSDVGVATVSESGLVVAVASGTASIRAAVDGKIGTGALQVTPAAVATVTLDATTLALLEGDTRVLQVIAKDAAGNVLNNRTIVWESTNPAAATVTATGSVTALAAGTTVVRATVEGKTAQSNVTVTRAPVASVVPSETALSLAEGATKLLTAVVKDAAGRVLNARTIAWTTDNAAVATVDANGRVTALSLGRANIRVTSENITAVVAVTVTGAPVGSVLISPEFTRLEIGEMLQLQATVKDVHGRVIPNSAVTWNVTGGNSSITAGGLITGRRNGPVTLTATHGDIVEVREIFVVAGFPYAWDLLYHRNINNVQEIFTLKIGTSTPPVRINAGTVSRAPTASPDGLRIAFAVSQADLLTGNLIHDLFAVDRTGQNVKQLTNFAGIEDAPSWSPDGTRIAFVRYQLGERADVWTMRPDGTDAINLTADLPNGVAPGMPTWSPNGSRIAFVQSTSGAGGTTAKICTMRADGSDKRELTSTLTGFDSSPTWSADGQRIAFVRYFGADADIAIIGADGGAVTQIPMPGLQSNPSWSPDGFYIAYHQIDGPLSNVYTMRPDGSGVRLRTVDTAWGGGLAPKWIRSN